MAKVRKYNREHVNSPTLASRSATARPSPTLALTARANQMKAEGHDVISFGAGEPDFNTPEVICAAAIDAIRAGFTKYTASAGIKELREAISQKLLRENQLSASPDQVIVSCGAKHSLYNAMQMVVDPGDEVILLAPYWMTYFDQVKLAQGVPIVVSGDPARNFEPELEAIQSRITAKTKAIVVNSPCNPTGAVFTEATLRGIADIAERHNLWIVSDEIYERLVYKGAEHHTIAAFSPEIAARTIMISGCSKTFSMTGWRIGFAAVPHPVAKAMSAFQDQVTSNPTSFAQKAAITAMNCDPDLVEAMRTEFESRRNLTESLLQQIPNLGVPDPKGAFYFLFNVSAYLGGEIANDAEMAQTLLEKGLVAMVPGSAFDAPGFLRLSYTAGPRQIQQGIERLGNLLANVRT